MTYNDPSPGDDGAAVQDEAGNDAANFTQTVTNNSTVTEETVTRPGRPTSLTATAGGADGDPPVLDRAGRHRRFGDRRLPDRGLSERRRELERPRRRHRQREHDLHPTGTCRRARRAITGSRRPMPKRGAIPPIPPTRRRRVRQRRRPGPKSRRRRPTARPACRWVFRRPRTSGIRGSTCPGALRADTGGADIAGYRIEVSDDGSDPWTVLVTDTGGADTSYSDTGLPPGATRHYRVSAINAEGPGEPSAVVHATTPTRPPGMPVDLQASAHEGDARDRPVLDRAGRHRRRGHRRLPDRGLGRRRRELERARGGHRWCRHLLFRHRPAAGRDPALPGLGHQCRRARRALRRRPRDHAEPAAQTARAGRRRLAGALRAHRVRARARRGGRAHRGVLPPLRRA